LVESRYRRSEGEDVHFKERIDLDNGKSLWDDMCCEICGEPIDFNEAEWRKEASVDDTHMGTYEPVHAKCIAK
jgi:hypothetical protein